MPANALRIIGGRWRGRKIHFPRAAELRPTPDRVRETLFNWLGQDLSGRTTLDPFAGSGALSLEALSRGAMHAVALDRDSSLVRALRATAEKLGTTALETHCVDALLFLMSDRRTYDVVFLDPPFAQEAWANLLPAAAARLTPQGRLYVEARTLIEPPEGLEILRRDKAGRVHYHLLRRAG
jgi:16S rRNA (guanine966-N2)-methyltransferase